MSSVTICLRVFLEFCEIVWSTCMVKTFYKLQLHKNKKCQLQLHVINYTQYNWSNSGTYSFGAQTKKTFT